MKFALAALALTFGFSQASIAGDMSPEYYAKKEQIAAEMKAQRDVQTKRATEQQKWIEQMRTEQVAAAKRKEQTAAEALIAAEKAKRAIIVVKTDKRIPSPVPPQPINPEIVKSPPIILVTPDYKPPGSPTVADQPIKAGPVATGPVIKGIDKDLPIILVTPDYKAPTSERREPSSASFATSAQ